MSTISTPTIDRHMTVREIVTLFPVASDVLALYNIHCFSCSIGGFETLEEGCHMHGMSEVEIGDLVNDINEAIADAPAKPRSITITKSAADAIWQIAIRENRKGEGLSVMVDLHGGFCMEFREKPEEDDCIFSNDENASVKIFVSPLTLARIGGATIDFREERFKLDLIDDCCGGSCDSTCGN